MYAITLSTIATLTHNTTPITIRTILTMQHPTITTKIIVVQTQILEDAADIEDNMVNIIRTTRKTGGLLTGYKPVVLGQRLKALAFTTFKPHSH